jgi:cell division protein FtsB
MKWQELKRNKYWRFFTNKYVLISILFLVWMMFLDANAWLTSHSAMNKQIAEKEQTADFYLRGIERDQQRIQQLKDSVGLEKFARERYLMKRKNEEVYIMEYDDSLNNNQ